MSSSASVVLAPLLFIYIGIGLASLAAIDHLTGGVANSDRAVIIVAGWPVVLFVAAVGIFAVWSTKRELETIGK
ncbi:MAG: hypothetical protein HQRvContig02_26 [Haloquadratum phage sp.]|nr:MAG: hypothetical protein HQRvContig02_26 [Haloquadratum phage sp.]